MAGGKRLEQYRNSLIFFLLFLLGLPPKNSCGQAQGILWQKSYGGSAADYAAAIRQTSDGGYIISGTSNSNDGDVSGNHGDADFWIVKTDSNGNIQWQRSYGGAGTEVAHDIQQTADGGYVIAGTTDSASGDVGLSYHQGATGAEDYWVVKIDSEGNIQWEKCYGGTKNDRANAVLQNADGGYIIAGESYSNDGDVTGNHSVANTRDYWVVKTDGGGNLLWQKCYGGLNDDRAFSIAHTSGNGFVVAGSSFSTGGEVGNNNGTEDFWVIKLDSAGMLKWGKTMGGTNGESANAVQQTNDGGYIVAGYTNSNDKDVSGNHGSYDVWVVKLDSAGDTQWKTCYGGTGSERAYSLQQTFDGGYIVAGSTSSNDGDVSGYHGGGDYWILKLDVAGVIQWEECFGGTGSDNVSKNGGIQQTSDGAYIVAGASDSNDGNVTGNHGDLDYWVLRLDGPTAIHEITQNNDLLIYPNPCSAFVNIERLPESADFEVMDIVGKTVKYGSIATGRALIDVRDLQSGIYIISVRSSLWVFTGKMLVQK